MLDNLQRKLNKIAEGTEILSAIGEEVTKKAKANTNSGDIKRDLQYEIDNHTVRIGTNVFYSAFTEFGTGRYAENGNGTSGYWVFVKTPIANPIGPIPGLTGAKHYPTYEEAEKTKFYLMSLGISSSDIVITNGQKPHPFLRPALHDTDIKEIVTNKVREL